MKLSRRRFLCAMGCSGVLGVSYMRWWEPGWLQVGRHNVPVKSGLPEVKILHLSDLHASSSVSLEQIGSAIDVGLSLKPDLICLTGDFITTKYDSFPQYAQVLKRLSDSAPTFASLGNHDGGSWAASRGYADVSAVSGMLQDAGIQLLHNSSFDIQSRSRSLTLVGVGDLWAKDLDPDTAFGNVVPSNEKTVILLSHNPDSKKAVARYPWNLMLCGHTHGGQLVLPLLGRPFLPIEDTRFAEGLHRWNDRWIHVTRGVGNLHGMRFNCPPEVSLLTLA